MAAPRCGPTAAAARAAPPTLKRLRREIGAGWTRRSINGPPWSSLTRGVSDPARVCDTLGINPGHVKRVRGFRARPFARFAPPVRRVEDDVSCLDAIPLIAKLEGTSHS